MSTSRAHADRLRHARSAIRRAAADLRHAAMETRRLAVDLRNAALEIARAIYAVLLAALPATAEGALREARARARIRRRRFVAPQQVREPDLRPLPKVVVPVPSRASTPPDEGHVRAPTTLLVVLGAEPEGLSEIVSEAERLAATLDLRPVFLTDSDAFQAFRDGGWLFEYLPPREEWERIADDGAGYDAFVDARMAELNEIYRPARIVAVGTGGHLGRLGALLGGPPLHSGAA